jgi:hypothetical protein
MSDLYSSTAAFGVGFAFKQPQVKRLEIWRITDTNHYSEQRKPVMLEKRLH